MVVYYYINHPINTYSLAQWKNNKRKKLEAEQADQHPRRKWPWRVQRNGLVSLGYALEGPEKAPKRHDKPSPINLSSAYTAETQIKCVSLLRARN